LETKLLIKYVSFFIFFLPSLVALTSAGMVRAKTSSIATKYLLKEKDAVFLNLYY